MHIPILPCDMATSGGVVSKDPKYATHMIPVVNYKDSGPRVTTTFGTDAGWKEGYRFGEFLYRNVNSRFVEGVREYLRNVGYVE